MFLTDRHLLAKLPLFVGLTPDDLNAVLKKSRLVHYPKNTFAFQQDEEAKFFFLLLHGYMRAEQNTDDGVKIVVRYIFAGEIFGAIEAIGLKRSLTAARAVVDSSALAWPVDIWPQLVVKYSNLAVNALQEMGGLLQDARARMIEMQTDEVERRVARALLRLTNRAGRGDGTRIEIDVPLRRQDIAEITGATLHTVSRILSAWDRKGLTASARQRIILRSPNEMLDIAEGRRRMSATSNYFRDGGKFQRRAGDRLRDQ